VAYICELTQINVYRECIHSGYLTAVLGVGIVRAKRDQSVQQEIVLKAATPGRARPRIGAERRATPCRYAATAAEIIEDPA